jgi:ribonuclease P protein component
MPPITTLKVRAEFLAVRGGARASVPVCLIEARTRRTPAPGIPPQDGPRFGFTVTKKLGNAVTRNRIRRRLKAAISELAPSKAVPGFDYVVVARAAAFDRPYPEIVADLTRAFAILHSTPGPKRSSRPKNPAGKMHP